MTKIIISLNLPIFALGILIFSLLFDLIRKRDKNVIITTSFFLSK